MSRKRKSADRSWIRRGLCAEQLEPRAMLAAVTVTDAGSTLIVRGTSGSDEIAIVQVGDQEYAVVGLNGTEVERRGSGGDDSDDQENVIVAQGIRNITVDLGNGDDLLSVGNDVASLVEDFGGFDFLGEILVDTSAAEDALAGADAPEEFSLDGTLNIRMGNNEDAVAVIANVGGSVIVDLGSGNANGFSFDGGTLSGGVDDEGSGDGGGGWVPYATVGGSLIAKASSGENDFVVNAVEVRHSIVITGGKSGDFIDVSDVETGGSVVINSGNGGDEIFVDTHLEDMETTFDSWVPEGPGTRIHGSLVINSGSGNDLIVVEATEVHGSATINAGSGNDSGRSQTFTGEAAGVVLDGLFVGHALTVILGTGDDSLVATGVRVGHNAIVDGGSGNDDVLIDGCEVGHKFLAIMGSGRDRLEIVGSTADKIGLNGGSGDDTLIADFNEDDERVLYIISFENDEEDEVA